MALSDTTIIDIELTDTFETWRTRTNRIITLLNESADEDPFTSLVSANSEGGFSINAVQSNVATMTQLASSNLTITGATSRVNFSGANTQSLGNVHQVHVLGGLVITGSNPDSSISNTQINNSEINLNGQKLRANGASTIDFAGATIQDLGTVQFLKVTPAEAGASGGELSGINVISNTSYTSNLRLNGGAHTFDGAEVQGGNFYGLSISNSAIRTTNITMSTGATFIANTGVILGSDVTNSNVAIGHFPEWSGAANRIPTSSTGRLHVRSMFSKTAAGKTTPSADGSEIVVEGNTTVGMTFLANSASNSHIIFGDDTDSDKGFIKYENQNDYLVFGAKETQSKMRIQNDGGGSMQIAGANTFESIAGKMHIYQASNDGLDALYIHTTDGDKRAIHLNLESEDANAVEISTTTLTSGHMMTLEYGASTTSFTGSMLNINDNNQELGERKIVSIVQDHRDATATKALYLQSDGGELLDLVQNREDKIAIRLTANSTTSNVSDYFMDTLTTGTGLHISSDSDNHTSNLVSLITNSTSATATTLSIKNISTTNQNLISVANGTSSVMLMETGGNIGINNNGQQVKVLAANGSLMLQQATVPLHKLHLHGTLGVENESIFNADMRINANVTIQNGLDSMLIIDSPDVGSATLAIGENADTSGHQAFYVTYPVGDGYTYLGMGALDFQSRIPLNYAFRLNGFNNDILMTGDVELQKGLTVNNDITVSDGDITSNGIFELTGNAYINSNTVIIESVNGVGSTRVDDVLTITGNTNIQGQLNVETANTRLGSNLTVVGNTVFEQHITTSNTATFNETVTLNEHVFVNSTMNVANNVIMSGSNVYISESDSITTIVGQLNVDNKMVMNGANVYISPPNGKFEVRGSTKLNNLEVTGDVGMPDIEVSGNVQFGSHLVGTSSTANSVINGKLNVLGNTHIGTDVINATLGPSGEKNVLVKGNTIFAGVVSIQSELNVTTSNTRIGKDLIVNKNLYVSGNTEISGNAVIDGILSVSDGDIVGSDNLTISGNMDVGGSNVIFSHAGSSGNVAIMSNLYVENDAKIQGGLSISGGDVTASDDLNISGKLDVVGKSSFGDITSNGNMTIKGTTNIVDDGTGAVLAVSKVGAIRSAAITGSLSVSGDMSVGGTTSFADATFTSLTATNLTTTSSLVSQGSGTFNGLSSTSDITSTGNINANGVKCRLPVYDASGVLLNAA